MHFCYSYRIFHTISCSCLGNISCVKYWQCKTTCFHHGTICFDPARQYRSLWRKREISSLGVEKEPVEVKNEIHATLGAIVLFIIHLETMEITKLNNHQPVTSPQKFTTHYHSAYPLVVGALGGKQSSPILVQACLLGEKPIWHQRGRG